ncbi:MAG TPA: CoA transferase [Geminicoccaceae bacterium]|nr:CoA transferase [Geminicoccaceae bacterium]
MPLSGIRVVDLTRILAGPFCTQLLADFGAEVIKVEPPGRGDPVRGQGTIKDGLSWYYAQFNRNKKSLTLDLYRDEGKAVLADLIRGADVLVENYRPEVLAGMGFDAARLEALNPGLIVASVNGYGGTGPYVDRPAFDFIAQAMSGFMSVSGAAAEPMRAGPPIADLVAGLYAGFGIVAALVARGRAGSGPGPESGQGQCVEASLTGGLISMLAYFSAKYFVTGEPPERTGNDHPVVYPYGLFHAADGEVAIAPSTPVHVRRLLETLELAGLLDDPAFADNAARVRNRERLRGLIDARIGTATVETWIARLNAAGVPCGRVMNLAEVFADPQVQAQEMVLEVEHPGHGPVRMTGFPVKLSATPARLRRPAPKLGEHTETVLRELGYSADQIALLRERGIL